MNQNLAWSNKRCNCRGNALLIKVPQITLLFWIVKLLSTAMGEATSDYMVFHMNQYLAVALGGIGFVMALILQFSVRRYVVWIYWLVVVMIAIFGTMVADATHIVLGVPYFASTITFAIVLAVVFIVWYKVEGTLSIHSIDTRRREIFYWATVLTTFALGTAAGDMAATTLHLGYLGAGNLFLVLFLLPFVCQRLFGLNAIFTFWFAYVMTRPLGASFADWFGVAHSGGGLGYGRGTVSILLTILIVVLVGYMCVKRVPQGNRRRTRQPSR